MFVLENTACLSMSLYNSEENIGSVYKCAFKKVCNLLNLERKNNVTFIIIAATV